MQIEIDDGIVKRRARLARQERRTVRSQAAVLLEGAIDRAAGEGGGSGSLQFLDESIAVPSRQARPRGAAATAVALTAREVADALGIGLTKMYELLDGGDGIPSVKIGRSRRIEVSELTGWLEMHRNKSVDRGGDSDEIRDFNVP